MRLDRRAAGGDDVLDHEAAVAGLEQRPLDAPGEAVVLGLLAHEERLDVGAAGQRRAGDRVGAHRQPAHRRRAQRARALGHELGQGGEPVGAQDRPLRVDQVLGLGAAGQRDLADDERVPAEGGHQSLVGAHRPRMLIACCNARGRPSTSARRARGTSPTSCGRSRWPSASRCATTPGSGSSTRPKGRSSWPRAATRSSAPAPASCSVTPGWIGGLGVEPGSRRRGIASRLTDAVVLVAARPGREHAAAAGHGPGTPGVREARLRRRRPLPHVGGAALAPRPPPGRAATACARCARPTSRPCSPSTAPSPARTAACPCAAPGPAAATCSTTASASAATTCTRPGARARPSRPTPTPASRCWTPPSARTRAYAWASPARTRLR